MVSAFELRIYAWNTSMQCTEASSRSGVNPGAASGKGQAASLGRPTSDAAQVGPDAVHLPPGMAIVALLCEVDGWVGAGKGHGPEASTVQRWPMCHRTGSEHDGAWRLTAPHHAGWGRHRPRLLAPRARNSGSQACCVSG